MSKEMINTISFLSAASISRLDSDTHEVCEAKIDAIDSDGYTQTLMTFVEDDRGRRHWD